MLHLRPGYFFFFLTFLMSAAACVPVEEKVEVPFDISFDNEQIRNIYELQKRQEKDSLITYLQSKDPSVRYAAARAFASFHDSTSLSSLLPLLTDPHVRVRAMAAEAVGLIGARSAEAELTAAFDGRDSARMYEEANGAILEAMGRIGSLQFLHALSTISTYQHGDTLLLLGQARGIYRYALREMIIPEGTATMVNYFTDPLMPFQVRLMAAHYLHRAANLDLNSYAGQLMSTWHSESHPHLRMCLATALGKLKTSAARDVLVQSLPSESDYRVKCNILRALQTYSYDDVRDIVIEYAKSGNTAIAEVAAQYFVIHGKEKDAALYRASIEQCKSWQAKAKMAEAANKYMTSMFSPAKTSLQNEIKSNLERSDDVYEKAAWLKAWSSEIRNFESIPPYAGEDHHVVVRTQAVQSLIDVSKDKNFDNYFAGEGHLIRSQIGGYLANAMRTGDAGVLALIAGAILDPETGMKAVLRDQQAGLSKAMNNLVIPAEMETYQELAKALKEYNVETPRISDDKKGVRAIDWNMVDKWNDNGNVQISTNKGNIQIKLFPQRAPATISSFLELAEKKYYNGKPFHRVVPNFVIQTGCPRGDGFGSLNFTIRSELAGAYYDDEGYIGMASAGAHTEGPQFFITHSPTPHLDGRYTIFGQVISGMEIVHNIAIGDTIKEININY